MDYIINRYLNTAKLFNYSLPGISQEQLVQKVKDNLANHTDVTLKTYGSNAGNLDKISGYFIFLAYGLICILLLSISSIMTAFNQDDLKRRIFSSPLHPVSFNLQLFLGHVVLAAIVWVSGILLGLLTCGTAVIGPNYALMCLNALCLVIAILCLSSLISRFVDNYAALNGITNVLALGMSFLSGVFIPQSLLSPSVLDAARFLPTYWYVKAVNDISNLSVFSIANLLPIIYSMLIVLGFGAAFFSVSLVLGKRKNTFG
jgi:ABC-2 type transport system permease protein